MWYTTRGREISFYPFLIEENFFVSKLANNEVKCAIVHIIRIVNDENEIKRSIYVIK